MDNQKAYMLTQEETAYTVLSTTPAQACVNCRWFCYEDNMSECKIVQRHPQPIVLTGMCNRWEAIPAASEPALPVVIVEAEEPDDSDDSDDFMDDEGYRALKLPEYATRKERVSFLQAVYTAVKSLFAPTEHVSGFKAIGNHWFAVWSNNFADKQGETFSEKAIDDFIARVDAGAALPLTVRFSDPASPLPDLWFWHMPLVSGKADVIARVDHMVIAAGHFDDTEAGRAFADYYSKTKEVYAVSHGFRYPRGSKQDGVYTYFDTFEISPLPAGMEANEFTFFEGGLKEMVIPDNKRAHLESMFGKQRAATLLESVQTAGKEIESLGVSYKGLETDMQDEKARADIVALTGLVGEIATSIKALSDIMKKPPMDDEEEAAAAKKKKADMEKKSLDEAAIARIAGDAVTKALNAYKAEQAGYAPTISTQSAGNVLTAHDELSKQLEAAAKANGQDNGSRVLSAAFGAKGNG